MLLQAGGRDTAQKILSEVPESRTSSALARGASINSAFPLLKEADEARAPAQRPCQRNVRGPLITPAIGLIVLTATLAGGYIYWDYARHFEWTDDAFVTSRQFIIAPKVSG